MRTCPSAEQKLSPRIKDNEERTITTNFLTHRIAALVRRYSDYIRYPIRMDMPKRRLKEGCPRDKPEYEDYTEKRNAQQHGTDLAQKPFRADG